MKRRRQRRHPEIDPLLTEEEAPPPPEPEPAGPEPDDEYIDSCDYLLGDDSEYTARGYRFVAGTDIDNTGNVGIVVKVTAKWKQLGANPVTVTKTAKVKYGESKSVQITKPVGGPEIEAIQAVQDAGNYCSVKGTIVDTFGPHALERRWPREARRTWRTGSSEQDPRRPD